MDTISLFSGCGGMDFGARNAGAKILMTNDIDPDCCATLRNYFHDTEVVEGSIAKIDEFPAAELVIGGYPCQSFSMGGNRNPETDNRTSLYEEFSRCLQLVQPNFFVAENVDGLKKLKGGTYLEQQINRFKTCGQHGYRVTYKLLDARDYGVPQRRQRLFIVGVRQDIGLKFEFPPATHGQSEGLLPYLSHGDAIQDLPLWPEGEFYERPHDPEGHWPWYYMSRNRKAPWDSPSYTIVANWRHTPVHPASPRMTLTWSRLNDGFKQRWDFTNEYEHTVVNPNRPVLAEPRRLSWRETARIQTFPPGFEPVGKVESKFTQIGNAVPVLLAQAVLRHLISGAGLVPVGE